MNTECTECIDRSRRSAMTWQRKLSGGQSSVRRKSCSKPAGSGPEVPVTGGAGTEKGRDERSPWECRRHRFSWTSSMAGSKVLVMRWTAFTTLCSVFQPATEQFPHQTVVQLVRILSAAQLWKNCRGWQERGCSFSVSSSGRGADGPSWSAWRCWLSRTGQVLWDVHPQDLEAGDTFLATPKRTCLFFKLGLRVCLRACRLRSTLPSSGHHSVQADRHKGHVLQSRRICQSSQHHQGSLHRPGQSGEVMWPDPTTLRCLKRFVFGSREQIWLTLSRCRKPTRSGLTRSSSTWWSFRSTEARCPWWWRVPKAERGLTPSPRTRSPTRDCAGTTFERRRESNAPSGRASSAPSGRLWRRTQIGRRTWMQLWDLNENLRKQRHLRKRERKPKNRNHSLLQVTRPLEYSLRL